MKIEEINKIKILGKPYKVVWMDGDKNVDFFEGKLGKSNHILQIIYIDDACADEQKIDTFIHEVLHCIIDNLDLRLEEKQVHALACAITSFILENAKNIVFTD